MAISERITELEKQIALLPQGSVVYKNIRGKRQPYLQWRENGKIKSAYLKAAERETVIKQVELRKKLSEELKSLRSTADPSEIKGTAKEPRTSVEYSTHVIDAFQALVYITNSVQTECEGYAILGEYEPCKECLEEFKSFIVENKLNERDTLLLLNENSSQKQIEVVDQFTDIASRITTFDPKAQIGYSAQNLLTAEVEHTGGDSNEQ